MSVSKHSKIGDVIEKIAAFVDSITKKYGFLLAVIPTVSLGLRNRVFI